MTKTSKNNISRKFLLAMAVMMATSGLSLNYLLSGKSARATDYEQQIRRLKEANAYYEKEAYQLRKKADSLAGEVELINQEKAQIQTAIDQINARIEVLNNQITRLEKDIDNNREALGDVLAKIYLSSNVSTIERLASARAITDFIDEEAQAQTMRQNITTKLQEIKRQREQVSNKKDEQIKALALQKKQMATQQKLEQEKQALLDQTRGDEAEYKRLTSVNNSQIEELRLAQKKANCAAIGGTWLETGVCYQAPQAGSYNIPQGVPGGGGYPGQWAFAPLDAYVDPWGLYTRECVSYVAWKIHSTGRFVPHFGGRGNANQWPSTTARHGIPQGSQPKAGSAAVSMVGYYGHVMYVEAVHGDGTITVSDYNLLWDGNYRIYRRSASGLIYIYF